jgi:hypothetical protein
MHSTQLRQNQEIVWTALPVLIDAGIALAIFLTLPALSSRLAEPSGLNALLLVLLYLVYAVGVYFSRKLLPGEGDYRWAPPAWSRDPKVRGVMGLIFAFFMATTFAYQLGYFESIFDLRAGLLQEGSTAALLVYAPGSWLGFSMLMILVLAFPVDSNVEPGETRYAALAVLSLLLTDSLLVFAGAQVNAMVKSMGAQTSMGLWLLVLAAFVISLLPARAVYQRRRPFLSGWISFALLLLFATTTAVFS